MSNEYEIPRDEKYEEDSEEYQTIKRIVDEIFEIIEGQPFPIGFDALLNSMEQLLAQAKEDDESFHKMCCNSIGQFAAIQMMGREEYMKLNADIAAAVMLESGQNPTKH